MYLKPNLTKKHIKIIIQKRTIDSNYIIIYKFIEVIYIRGAYDRLIEDILV